jgi:transposase
LTICSPESDSHRESHYARKDSAPDYHHDKEAYKGRNVIERCFCRLKDFRRIATRYDKLARNYFSSVCLIAAVVYWLTSLLSQT